jgi:glutamate synthase domain-containing protein 3
MKKITIDAGNLHYKDLNALISKGAQCECRIILNNVYGQRYIGLGLSARAEIIINGIPGNDMAAYMDGAKLEVFGNAQDVVGNTMNCGQIIIRGSCGDTAGYAMRGGEIYIEGNAGYRLGIHMKEYKETKPVIVVGGSAGDFMGEYMAGGAIIVLGLGAKSDVTGRFCGSGMHGGQIYLHGKVGKYNFGAEAVKASLNEEDKAFVGRHLANYEKYFKKSLNGITPDSFAKYIPANKNPYKHLYCKH